MKTLNIVQMLFFVVMVVITISNAKKTRNEKEVVTLQFDDYDAKDLEKDLNALLNDSVGALIPVIFKRYPRVLNVIKEILNKTAQTNFTMNTSELCLLVESAFNTTNDACNVPDFLLEASMWKICKDSDGNVSLFDNNLAGLCDKPASTTPVTTMVPVTTYNPIVNLRFSPTNFSDNDTIMFGGGMLPSNTFFIAIKALTGTVSEARRRKCLEHGGAYNTKTMLCTKNSTIINLETGQKALKIISIFGHLISFLSCVTLVACYVIFKRSDTLPGKNTICLSSSLALTHFIQFVLIFTSKEAWACRAGATFLHWSLLLAFAWMAILAFELYKTFAKLRTTDKYSKNKRFKLYIGLAFTFATLMVFICLMVDIPNARYAGYGVKGACFVTQFWANLFAFIVPVSLILLSNICLLAFTICKLRAVKQSTEKSLSSSNSQTKRKKIVLSALTIKLSILFGIGWILAFIDGVHYNIVLRYLYTIIISSQGLLVFICFGCHKETWDVLSKKIYKTRTKLWSDSNTDTQTQQTSV